MFKPTKILIFWAHHFIVTQSHPEFYRILEAVALSSKQYPTLLAPTAEAGGRPLGSVPTVCSVTVLPPPHLGRKVSAHSFMMGLSYNCYIIWLWKSAITTCCKRVTLVPSPNFFFLFRKIIGIWVTFLKQKNKSYRLPFLITWYCIPTDMVRKRSSIHG